MEAFNGLRQLTTIDNKSEFYNTAKTNQRGEKYDLTIIIPVRGRGRFFQTVINQLINAIHKTDKKINIVFVEHSDYPMHESRCKSSKVGYYWVEAKPNEPFNKCLAHNIGAIIYQNSDYFMFHDLDCIMYDDFFVNLFENINKKKSKAIQTFQKRRVLYLDDGLTKGLISNIIRIKNIEPSNPKITVGDVGAPGGSILVEKETFFNVGGYDPEFFVGHSPEDAYFWDKLETITSVDTTDAPPNELLHLSHPISDARGNVKYSNRYKSLKALNKTQFLEIIRQKKDTLKPYIND